MKYNKYTLALVILASSAFATETPGTTNSSAPPAASSDPANPPAASSDPANPPAASSDPANPPAASSDPANPPPASSDPANPPPASETNGSGADSGEVHAKIESDTNNEEQNKVDQNVIAEDEKKKAEQKQKDDDEKAMEKKNKLAEQKQKDDEKEMESKKLAEKEQKEAEVNKTTADLIAKIKAALANVKDFSELSTEAIKALGLTEKQVEALKKANVTKDTTDEDIKKALNAEADATPNTQTKGAKDINASKDEPSKGDKAEVPFYMNAWIMVPSSVILLSAIGGGAYMMTRKTEDTDL
jgi:hypothetical protein